jgi:hypothetical protein
MLGEEDTPAADVFGLGVTLVELLTQEPFGRIPPRPQKFQVRLDEILAALPLTDEPAGWADRARQTLRAMLAYDPLARPTPVALVETLEALGAERRDDNLKKLCRASVAAAKEALPRPESDDPLVSRVVEEETSGLTSNSGPIPRPLEVANPASTGPLSMTPPPADSTGPLEEKPDSTWDEGPTGVNPSVMSAPPPPGHTPAPAPLTGLSIDDVGKEFETRKTGIAFGVVAAGLLGVAVLGVVGAVAGVAIVFGASGGNGVEGSAPEVSGGGGSASEPGPAPRPPGGRILSPDGRTDVPTSETRLAYSDPVGGTVLITSPSGFRAEWDGRAPFQIGPLAEGRYATVVTLGTGEKVRGRNFHVTGGRSGCTFTFDVAARDWVGGCP